MSEGADQAVIPHPDIKTFLDVIPENEISELRRLSDGPLRHPVCELIDDVTDPSPIARATVEAIRLVIRNDPGWMNSLPARIRSPDFANAAAALGEIRAYGTLAMAGVIPTVMNQAANPDFKIKLGSQTIVVEVHTKQMDKAAREKLDEWRNKVKAKVPPPGVSVQISPSIAPFGGRVPSGGVGAVGK